MSTIDERLEVMKVDTSEMTNEEKFIIATGLTHYDQDLAKNDWYVQAGAANVSSETSLTTNTEEEIINDTSEDGNDNTDNDLVTNTDIDDTKNLSEKDESNQSTPTAEVTAHIGEEVTDENKQYDLDNDNDIDEDDVAKASEIEIETESNMNIPSGETPTGE